jgi:hypothetical protein
VLCRLVGEPAPVVTADDALEARRALAFGSSDKRAGRPDAAERGAGRGAEHEADGCDLASGCVVLTHEKAAATAPLTAAESSLGVSKALVINLEVA